MGTISGGGAYELDTATVAIGGAGAVYDPETGGTYEPDVVIVVTGVVILAGSRGEHPRNDADVTGAPATGVGMLGDTTLLGEAT